MDIPSLKKVLLNPAIYPDGPKEVVFLETHISLLFLTGNYVYKVKKPVDFGFLDFTSLEKRNYYCHQEVKLNTRLAPSLYLGVVEIREAGGRVSLDGEGDVVEYAVKMNQLPESSLLDKLLLKDRLTPEMIKGVSAKLASFYATAETNEVIKGFATPHRVKQDTDENFYQTEKYVDIAMSDEIYSRIKDRTDRFLRDHKERFYGRINSDRIRDCHGDLRLEHISWGEKEISIFDCIEFNERFRYTDVAADIAFLAMDLDYHGRADLSDHLIRTYVEISGDLELVQILDFYKCYRAYVRGKVECFRLEDPYLPEKEKGEAVERAKKYFDLSYRYALKF